MLILLIPSSFASDLDNQTDIVGDLDLSNSDLIGVDIENSDSNQFSSDSNQFSSNSNQFSSDSNQFSSNSNQVSSDSIQSDDADSIQSDNLITSDLIQSKDSKSLGSGVNVDEGISVDYDNLTMITPKSAYINGTVYCIGNYLGKPFPGALNLTYSYIGDDDAVHSANFLLGSNGIFSLDITFFPNLSPRDAPYVFTISCTDERFLRLWDNELMPDPVDVYVYVEQGSALPVENNTIYVSPNGSDLDGSGHPDYPLYTVQRALELVAQMKQNCTIVLTEGVHTVDYVANNDYKYDLNIVGLPGAILDFAGASYGFEFGGTVSLSNLTFINAKGPRTAYYAPIKMSSTSGKILSVENCDFINCSGNYAGAISTYYGGTALLKVNNSNFINCKGTTGGAISVSYAKNAVIEHSSFINCSSSYGAIGVHTTTGGLDATRINYCIFSGNSGTNVSDVYTKKAENLEYNFWGTNEKPDSSRVSENSTITNYVILDIGADTNRVIINRNYLFSFDLTKYTDGNEIYSLDTSLPEIEISLSSDIGSFDSNPVATVNGLASSNYIAANTGRETINVYTPGLTETISFDILGDDSSVIYVATNGNDYTGSGTEASPYQTIAKALESVTSTKNTIYVKKGTYNEKDLLIEDTVTIIGEDLEQTIIDGQNNGRIFVISAYNANIELKTITLANGNPNYEDDFDDYDLFKKGQGGAIYLDAGFLKLNQTRILNSTSLAGGAIFADCGAAGSLTIIDSVFDNNSLDEDYNYYDWYFDILGGAAIYSDFTSMTITNSNFTNNHANAYDGYNEGGAIYVGDSLSLSGCIFEANSAEKGGAIYIDANNRSDVNIANSQFIANTASEEGAAIYSGLSASTSINSNVFDLNVASGDGGAIYAYGLNVKDYIRNNNFTNNRAQNGAAIYGRYAALTLSNNIMENNTANAIYTNNAFMNANITFLDNKTVMVNHDSQTELYALLTDDMGNPIANGVVKFTLDDRVISSGTTDDEGFVKISYNTNETLASYLVSGSFAGSNSSYPLSIKTAVLEVTQFYWFIGENGYFTLQDAVDASEEGDVLTAIPGAYSYEEVAIGSRMDHIYKNLTIRAENLGDLVLAGLNGRLFNIAYQFYGDYNHRPSQLTLENVIIENSTDEYGGAIYNDGYFIANNCIFRYNSETNYDTGSKWHGGAIMNWRDMKINNCTFESNYGISGAAINTESLTGTVIITNTIFRDNTVSDVGGAIYAAGYSSNYLIMENCSFINNIAAGDEMGSGGALFTVVNTTLINCEFINNTAEISGGAIYSGDYLTCDNISIEGSSAGWGGACFLVPSYSTTTSSTTDGETVVENIETYILNNSEFKNNYAEFQGGTIYAGYYRISTGFLENCSIINSSSGEWGGAISNGLSNCTITNVKFYNISSALGGAIYNFGEEVFDGYSYVDYIGRLFVTGCEFENISSTTNGGAISNDDEYTYMELENSSFKNIAAGAIGGVIFNNGILNLKNNVMDNASAETASYIYNNYSTSRVYLKFLNAETVYYSLGENSTYTLFVNVTDDMGNPISGGYVGFYVDGSLNSSSCEVLEGIAIYDYIVPDIGEYKIGGVYTGSSEGMFIEEKGTLIATKLNTTQFAVENDPKLAGDSLIIKLIDNNENPMANAMVEIEFIENGKSSFINQSTDDEGQIAFENLAVGNYTIKASYLGEGSYLGTNFTYDFAIGKFSTDILFDLTNNQLRIVLMDISNNLPIASAPLQISLIDGKGQTTYINQSTNGEGVLSLSLSKGNYLLKAEYMGDDSYLPSENSTDFDIRPVSVALSLENTVVYIDDSFTLEIGLVDVNGQGLNANVLMSFNGQDKNISLVNGKASVKMDPILYVGEYPITLFYLGDDTYDVAILSDNITVLVHGDDNDTNQSDENETGPGESNVTHTGNDALDIQTAIDKANPGDIINLGDYDYTDVSNINITKNITIAADGASIASANDGNPIFNILPVSAGVENVTIDGIDFILGENDVLVSAIAENGSGLMIEVPEINILNNALSTADGVSAESITVLKLESERGVLSPTNVINVSKNTLESGMNPFLFDVTSATSGSDAYVPIGGNFPEKLASEILCANMTTNAINTVLDGRNGEYFNFQLVDSNGKALANKPIVVGFNGHVYSYTTDEKGSAKTQINLGVKGGYTFAISFLGDESYNASFAVAKITVNPEPVQLTTAKKTYKASAKTKTLTATFKTSRGTAISGKKISFTVNGKTYTASTNAKGVATVKVSISKKGTYSFTAKFAGDERYKAVSVKSTLKLS